jgi:hypothetical protein
VCRRVEYDGAARVVKVVVADVEQAQSCDIMKQKWCNSDVTGMQGAAALDERVAAEPERSSFSSTP